MHPQSIVHSLIQLCDGATLAHLGYPDMRVPISYALHYPERVDVPVRPLDLAELGALTFEPVDTETFACLRLARAAGDRRRDGAVHAQRRQRGRRARVPRGPAAVPRDRRGDRADARASCPRERVHSFDSLADADAEARRVAKRPRRRVRKALSDLIRTPATLGACPTCSRFLGFAALIILHEAGHFAAAKAVGMRVERFSLFFGPLLVKFRRGETEYGIGPIPLGGYVKITGMNPNEEIPRTYSRAPTTTSRSGSGSSVILAGPAVNLLIAFIIWPCCSPRTGNTCCSTASPWRRGPWASQLIAPASPYLRPGDRIVAVDGRRDLSVTQIHSADRQPPLRRDARRGLPGSRRP